MTVFAVITLRAFRFTGNEATLHDQLSIQQETSILHSIFVFRPTSARFLLVLCVIPWSASETTIVKRNGSQST